MASTNKTTHYELSQYVGSDKPTYLTDYNGDMLAIDTGIYNAQTKADSAYSSAGVADGKAVQAQSDATTALNSAGTANTNIGTMANLTTTDKTSLVGAVNEVNYNLGLFNLTTYSQLTISTSKGTVDVNSELYLAKNANGSIFKVYGQIDISGFSSTEYEDVIITTSDTGLRPSSSYTITAAGIKTLTESGGYITREQNQAITVNTDGTISIAATVRANINSIRIIFSPCLYFNSDFGDSPIPE